RHPMVPFDAAGRAIQPTMGSLVSRHLAARMGYFNPHVDESHVLSAIGYVHHWLRYYAFSSRSLFGAWAFGAIRTVLGLARARFPGTRERWRRGLREAARETGSSLLTIARHARLFAKPAEDRLHAVVRILWLDRVALAFVGVLLATLALIVFRGAPL